MTNFEKIKEFHRVFKRPFAEKPTIPLGKVQDLRIKLMKEELEEVIKAIENGDLKNLSKELADLLVVTYGTADAYGIDADKAMDLVHKSNMSKLDNNGQPIIREDGKVMKGPNYKEPDMSELFK